MKSNSTKFVCSIPIIAFAIFLSACGSKDENAAPEQVIRPIKLLTLEKASDRLVRRFPAAIEAEISRKLSFSVGGQIVEIPVNEAEPVKMGDVIARLDTRDYQNQLDSAQAQFENAEDEYQRATRLAKENAIAKSALDQRKAQRDVAKAQLDSAEKAISDSTLRSPISGVITSVSATTLQNIGPGEPVATVISGKKLQATVNLPASLMTRAESRTENMALVYLDAAPSQPIVAEFKEATLEADPTTQTFGITFTFESPENILILPGMSATIELSSSGPEGELVVTRVSVPLGSILSEGDSKFVWVVDKATMTVSKREIQIEDGIGEEIAVIDGLSVGDTIAAAGASYLSEGMQVRPWAAE